MSSSNWLSMMGKSASRGGSLAHKQGFSPTMSFMPRSTSTSLSKNQVSCKRSQSDQQKLTVQMFKILHLLNVKIKKSYLYSFCKIEQLYKHRVNADKQCSKNTQKQSIDEPIQSLQDHNKNHSMKKEEISSLSRIKSGIERLCVFESSLSSRINTRQQSTLISSNFKRLRDHSSRSHSIEKIEKLVQKKVTQNKMLFIKGMKEKENESIRAQIMADSLEQLSNRYLRKFFTQIKQVKKIEKSTQIIQKENVQKQSTIGQKEEQNQIQFFSEEVANNSKSEKHTESEEGLKRRVKIKQKKISSCKLIELAYIIRAFKAAKEPKEDPALERTTALEPCTSENMRRFLTLKPQNLVNSLPDLTDNCAIFGQWPHLDSTFSADASHVVKRLQGAEPRSFIEEYSPLESYPSERTNEDSRPLSHYPQTSATSYNSRKNGQVLSPLMRVEQLLSNMKNLQHNRSISREKKMVNIKIPKEWQEMDTPVKTPRMMNRNCHHLSYNKSADKENFIGERLVTEKVVKEAKGGIESNKAKSTMLVKQKKSKCEKSQMFSARKMKLEIQNIINRRNRQLRQMK